jgi:hypothetical protein
VRFQRTHEWPAPSDAVLAMLLDPVFREAVCQEQEATSYDVAVSASAPPATVSVQLDLSMDGAPSAARKVTGDSVRTEQEETWESTSQAGLRIVIPGKPGALSGRISLLDHGDGTSTQHFDAQVKVSIPLIGGRLEPLIGRVLGSGLRREREVGLRWLTGQR